MPPDAVPAAPPDTLPAAPPDAVPPAPPAAPPVLLPAWPPPPGLVPVPAVELPPAFVPAVALPPTDAPAVAEPAAPPTLLAPLALPSDVGSAPPQPRSVKPTSKAPSQRRPETAELREERRTSPRWAGPEPRKAFDMVLSKCGVCEPGVLIQIPTFDRQASAPLRRYSSDDVVGRCCEVDAARQRKY